MLRNKNPKMKQKILLILVKKAINKKSPPCIPRMVGYLKDNKKIIKKNESLAINEFLLDDSSISM